MKIEGTHEIAAAREVVYRAMTDPQILQRCIPGCQSMEKTAENTYVATMKAGVGSVKGTFKGNVRLEDLHEPALDDLVRRQPVDHEARRNDRRRRARFPRSEPKASGETP
jgi:carbon monoxide dehydrogenase subunit G